MYPPHIRKLIDYFMDLPGVGPKTAAKYVFDLLNWDTVRLEDFMQNMVNIKSTIRKCDNCFNYTQDPVCAICNDGKRDHHTICVVAHYPDLLTIENLDEYKGLYHILLGTLNPLEGVTPDRLTIERLLQRIEQGTVNEIILALNPDIPGESTALYLMKLLKNDPRLKLTRIARGLPMGSNLEYADQSTLSSAMKGRQKLN